MIFKWKGLCAVCGRAEEGVGIVKSNYMRSDADVIWTCMEHVEHARGVQRVSNSHWERMESHGRAAADAAAGEYLMEIGKFDFRDLTEDEVDTFWKRGMDGWRQKMNELVLEEARK